MPYINHPASSASPPSSDAIMGDVQGQFSTRKLAAHGHSRSIRNTATILFKSKLWLSKPNPIEQHELSSACDWHHCKTCCQPGDNKSYANLNIPHLLTHSLKLVVSFRFEPSFDEIRTLSGEMLFSCFQPVIRLQSGERRADRTAQLTLIWLHELSCRASNFTSCPIRFSTMGTP